MGGATPAMCLPGRPTRKSIAEPLFWKACSSQLPRLYYALSAPAFVHENLYDAVASGHLRLLRPAQRLGECWTRASRLGARIPENDLKLDR